MHCEMQHHSNQENFPMQQNSQKIKREECCCRLKYMEAVDFVNFQSDRMIMQELAFIEIMTVPSIRPVESIAGFRCNVGAILFEIQIF